VLLACVALCAGSLYAATSVQDVYEGIASIQRIEIGSDVLNDRANADPGEPRNILLVGTTENDGIDDSDWLLAGRGNTLLADTIMVLRVEPNTGQAYVMSINRDVWVPGRGKINGVVQTGGPVGLVKVVKDLLGIPIDNYMQINFSGFRKVVDQLGGVPVYFPYAARDLGSFFDMDAGCHVLDGEAALNYVRSRYYEQRINNRWVMDPLSDYSRAERQRDFLVLALDRAIEKGARNPTVAKRLLHSATDSGALRLDEMLTVRELLDLAESFGGFEPENLQRMVLPGNGADIGGASAIVIDEAAAQPVLDIFRGNGNTLEPKQVTVEIIDARGKVDEQAKPDALLVGRGFRVNGRTQTPKDGATEPRTIVRYSADQRNAALLLSRFLWADPIYQEVTGLKKLQLTIGSDYQGVYLIAMPEETLAGKFPGVGGLAATTTSTTAAPTTTARGATTTTARGATTTTARGATTTTTTLAPPSGPSTTSGIYGRPPEGVTCK
jgi:LCP family protein required for cell wall assembly